MTSINYKPISKRLASEYLLRLQLQNEKINYDSMIKIYCSIPDLKFIKEFRKAIDLHLMKFSNNLFYIKY